MMILDERQFVAKQLEAHGFGVFDFYDDRHTLSIEEFCRLPLQRRGDVLLVDTQSVMNHPQTWESFKTVLNTFLGVIFFHEASNDKARDWVTSESGFLVKIIGEYSLPMPQLQWTMLSNQLQFLWTILQEQRALQKHMAQFSLELDQVLQAAETEMIRARKIHEVLVPKRSDEIKGIHFMNKYAAGDGGGGEFYDLLQSGSSIYQVLISSSSYLISSALIGLLNQHRQKGFAPAAFIAEAQSEILTINSAKKKKAEVDILITEIDSAHLTLKCYGEGHSELRSLSRGSIDKGTPYSLERGEKIIVFSPGFIFNWKEGEVREDVATFLQRHQQLGPSELLMELFFQLKNLKNQEFLSKDATVALMEVNRHGMHKI